MRPLLSVLILFSLTLSTCLHAKAQQPVRIILNDWASQLVMSYITAELLEKQGQQVLFIHSSTNHQWGQIKFDRADVQMEVWEGTMAAKFQVLKDAGLAVDLGDHPAKTREDWWYPLYLEEQCPGLPDWQALARCWKLFIHPDTSPFGRYLGGPWEKPDAARIRALQMNFRVERVTEDVLWSELETAISQKKPIVLFNWTPNWVENKYEGKFVEFPEWNSECEVNPKWGVNQLVRFDCGNPKDAWLKKVANQKLIERSPCAVELIKQITFNNSQISQLSHWVVREGLSEQKAAQRWLEQNQSTWQDWLDTSCKPTQTD
ncbi:ABC transporter substrate-binding protein [Dongshaea marina]|uniref:ABC transporter substrate-binding protein n=1 Tax=Dongshaea marina TaxID=2047966 RepID=UPI000D3E04C7|nr:ABC transporter substrate-binding protein [Dongshaea marina]